MAKRSRKSKKQKKRIEFRRNRLKPARQKQWDKVEDNEFVQDEATFESVQAKGALSRKRTVIDQEDGREAGDDLREARAVAVRGQFVDVDDGERVWQCTVRRILRTRRIEGRSPVVVGDRVLMRVVADEQGIAQEGVIEKVRERKTKLYRNDGGRTHIIAANVEQVLIVGSIREPMVKPHLFDRYLVAASAGELRPIICINKVDLDEDGQVPTLLDRFRQIGYHALATSVENGQGIEELADLLKDKATLLAGQSGVGKSSLLNRIQPGLHLRVGNVSTANEKGRHTTTTAQWLKLEMGGAVVDTPGIRALDMATVPLHELEMHFVEFVDRVAQCKFPDCVHIHEEQCAIKAAVEAGQIDPSRYESYTELFYELSEYQRKKFEG